MDVPEHVAVATSSVDLRGTAPEIAVTQHIQILLILLFGCVCPIKYHYSDILYEHHGVSNHTTDNSTVGSTACSADNKGTSMLHWPPFVKTQTVNLDSHHKEPIMRKPFLYQNVIMYCVCSIHLLSIFLRKMYGIIYNN